MSTSRKETSMTFRLEADLRDSFADAAKLNHRPAAQVLRDFMRDYIEATRSRAPLISGAKRQRREQAFYYARASVGLEGFNITSAEEKHAQRFINGEIDMPEFLTGYSNEAAEER